MPQPIDLESSTPALSHCAPPSSEVKNIYFMSGEATCTVILSLDGIMVTYYALWNPKTYFVAKIVTKKIRADVNKTHISDIALY